MNKELKTRIKGNDRRIIELYEYYTDAIVTHENDKYVISTPENTAVFNTKIELMDVVKFNLKVVVRTVLDALGVDNVK